MSRKAGVSPKRLKRQFDLRLLPLTRTLCLSLSGPPVLLQAAPLYSDRMLSLGGPQQLQANLMLAFFIPGMAKRRIHIGPLGMHEEVSLGFEFASDF